MSIHFRRCIILGASGLVGRTILTVLKERGLFAACDIFLYARQATQLSWDDDLLTVRSLEYLDQDIKKGDWGKGDVIFSALPDDISAVLLPHLCAKGFCVIDKSSVFRQESRLIVPEINGLRAQDIFQKRLDSEPQAKALNAIPSESHAATSINDDLSLVASPNCIVIPLTLVLKPLCALMPDMQIVLSTYQSVSGAGKDGMQKLLTETKSTLMQSRKEPHHIAQNIWPAIGSITENGYTTEETKIIEETDALLRPFLACKTDRRPIVLTATSVRVPVPIGHSMAVTVLSQYIIHNERSTPHQQSLTQDVTMHDAKIQDVGHLSTPPMPSTITLHHIIKAWQRCGYVRYVEDSDHAYEQLSPNAVRLTDGIHVGRLRYLHSTSHQTSHYNQEHSRDTIAGITFWVTADNLRRGAASNAVNILEVLGGHKAPTHHL